MPPAPTAAGLRSFQCGASPVGGAFGACWHHGRRPRKTGFQEDYQRPLNTATRNAVVAMIAICGAGCSPAEAESGQALDWATNEPVAGVEITLDCSRDPWFSGHSHVQLRTVTRLTDADGRYSFGVFDRTRAVRVAPATSEAPGWDFLVARPYVQPSAKV
jgi:hypothetical protein